MNKLQMAHEFMMKKMETETIDNHWELFYSSWRYADAMQAEADKRKSKPELPSLQQTFIDSVEQPRYAPSCDEWQPDWDLAPSDATTWKTVNNVAIWYHLMVSHYAQHQHLVLLGVLLWSAHNETQQEIQPEQSQQHYSNEIHAGTKAMDEIRQCFN